MAGSGDVIFQQHPPLFTSTGVIPQHAIATVQFNVPFRLLLANFSKNVAELKKSQIVAIATAAPSQVIPSHLTFTQVLGLEPLNTQPQMQSTVDAPASEESSVTAENKAIKIMDRVNKDVVPANMLAKVEQMLSKHSRM